MIVSLLGLKDWFIFFSPLFARLDWSVIMKENEGENTMDEIINKELEGLNYKMHKVELKCKIYHFYAHSQ